MVVGFLNHIISYPVYLRILLYIPVAFFADNRFFIDKSDSAQPAGKVFKQPASNQQSPARSSLVFLLDAAKEYSHCCADYSLVHLPTVILQKSFGATITG